MDGIWSQSSYLKASSPDIQDLFGESVSLSGDGATLGVGALGEASVATGVNGDQSDNTASESGALNLFVLP